MKRIAIIGGGISGLTAAFRLEQQKRNGVEVEYTLYEAAPRLGGVLVTEQVDGCIIEAGPDSFVTEKPWAFTLCRELGIADQVIGSNDADRKTYILVKNRLIEMPDGLMFMVPTKILPTVFTPLFSWGTKIRMGLELLHKPRPAGADESVAELVERHYGAEVVDRLADPLLTGVYGGEASKLSVRAVLPRFADMETKYGSLSRAMLAARKKVAAGNNGGAPRQTLGAVREKAPQPLFSSLKDGMQQLVDAVRAQLSPAAIRTGTAVRDVALRDGNWLVIPENGGQAHFDAVILATPAGKAGELIAGTHRDLAAELRRITYSSSVTITLGYDGTSVHLPPGFGFLVPRSEGRRMLACTFVHNKFPHRAPAGRLLLRVVLGGARDAEVLQMEDAQIFGIVRQELQEILGITAEPLFSRLYRWRGAMAQYEVGHLERVERIESLRKQLPGLALAGNAFRGIGVPDCIRTGMDAAAELTAELAATAQATR